MHTFFPINTEAVKNYPFYLTSIGMNYNETRVYRPQGYPHYQWVHTIKGSGEIHLNGKTYLLESCQGMYIPAYIPHEYHVVNDCWTTHWISFNGANIGAFMEGLQFNNGVIITMKNPQLIIQRIEEIYRLTKMSYLLESLTISTVIYHLLHDLYLEFTQFNKKQSLTGNQSFYTLLHYIDQYYMTELTIEELSNFIKITPQYLCKLFKKRMNKRPFEYVQEVRINKSKSLLLKVPTPSIQEVARAVGFEHPSYFGATFKKIEEMTPSQFIKLHQVGN